MTTVQQLKEEISTTHKLLKEELLHQRLLDRLDRMERELKARVDKNRGEREMTTPLQSPQHWRTMTRSGIFRLLGIQTTTLIGEL